MTQTHLDGDGIKKHILPAAHALPRVERGPARPTARDVPEWRGMQACRAGARCIATQ